jgi:hypothetical protein
MSLQQLPGLDVAAIDRNIHFKLRAKTSIE